MTLDSDLLDQLRSGDPATMLGHLRASGLSDGPGLSRVLDHAEGLLHSDPLLAERLVALCDEGLGPVHEPEVGGRASYLRAQLLAQRGELQQALELIGRARTSWLALGDGVAALRTDLGRMQVLDDLGRHQAAVQVGLELISSLDSRPDIGDDPRSVLVRAQATENLGVAYGLLGEHESALDAYATAEQGYRSLGMRAQSALPSANRGVELVALGRPREALAEFGRATQIFVSEGDRLFAAQCEGDTAQAHRQLGDLTAALRCLEGARLTLEELGASAEAARLQLALAETYLSAGLWTEARYAAEIAARATSATGMTHDTGSAHFIVGLAGLANGDTRTGLAELDLAESLFTEVNDRQYGARVRLARAQAALQVGDRAPAGSQLHLVEQELRDGGWMVPLAWAHLLQGDLADDNRTAENRLDRARPLVLELDLPELTYQYELRRGRLCRRQSRLAEAELHLRRAITELDRATGSLSDYVLLAAFRSERSSAHTELIDLLVDRGGVGDVPGALEVADESKARTLADLLSQTVGTGPSLTTGGPELGEAYAGLNALYLAQQQTDDPEARDALVHDSDRLEAQVSVLRLRLLTVPGRRLPVAPGHRGLGSWSGRLTVSFHVLGPDIVVFVLSGAAVTARRISGATARLHDLLDELGDQWSHLEVNLELELPHHDALLTTAQATLGDLHDLLIGPVEDLLQATDGDDLWIVPHGPMGAVPFAALYDGARYLVERWAVTLSPTLPAEGVAAPSTSGQVSAVVVAVPDDLAPAAEAEAHAVVAALPGAETLIGAEATVPAFTQAVNGAAIVHLACHGVHRPGNPLFSRIRLGDRWMTSAEAVQLSFDGALVTLSACESGTHGRNAEPIGLGWAFLAGGAAGVLASQWTIHDEATLTLMTALYDRLSTGDDPANALRAAQLHTARSYAHPYFWAAFSYVSNSLVSKKEEQS